MRVSLRKNCQNLVGFCFRVHIYSGGLSLGFCEFVGSKIQQRRFLPRLRPRTVFATSHSIYDLALSLRHRTPFVTSYSISDLASQCQFATSHSICDLASLCPLRPRRLIYDLVIFVYDLNSLCDPTCLFNLIFFEFAQSGELIRPSELVTFVNL